MLRHHKIICLRSINTFLALNCSHAKLGLLHATNLSNRANTTDSSRDSSLSAKVLDIPWPILIVFAGNLGTVAFQANHTTADSNYRILILISLIARGLSDTLARCLRILAAHELVVLSLVSETSDHHVSRLRRVGATLGHDTVRNVTLHDNVVFFDDRHVTVLAGLGALRVRSTVILLRLNDVAA